jgi:hypothetical protein
MFMNAFLVGAAAVACVGFLMVAGPITLEYLFNPAERQKRRHASKEWSYDKVYLPYESTSDGSKLMLETKIKYSEERGEYFYQSRKAPRSRWRKGWVEVTSDELTDHIKKELS